MEADEQKTERKKKIVREGFMKLCTMVSHDTKVMKEQLPVKAVSTRFIVS